MEEPEKSLSVEARCQTEGDSGNQRCSVNDDAAAKSLRGVGHGHGGDVPGSDWCRCESPRDVESVGNHLFTAFS